MHAAAIIAATSLSIETGTPRMTSGSRGTGDVIREGMPAKTMAAEPRSKIPRPIVTMIDESSDWPNSRRRTTRLKAIASATMPTHASPSAPPSPNPNPWRPDATIRDASMIHSPTAKLIMREALYTTTKARAASA